MARWLVWLFLFFFGITLLRYVLAGLAAGSARRGQGGPSPQPHGGGSLPLSRDPHCGAFVDPGIGIADTVDGKRVHFCSQDCKKSFWKERKGR